VFPEAMAETKDLALEGAPAGTRVTAFVADVSDESAVIAFRDAVSAELATDHINLLFNNAGIGGGGSFVADARIEWERTFGVDWGGVYHATRAFLPLLLAADEGHVVNTSSINGLWASIGPNTPHTSYSAAKFAVRGFSEALIADFRVNAPHLRVSVVMPGHIGTSIVLNSSKAHGQEPDSMDAEELDRVRQRFAGRGLELDGVSDDDLRKGIQMMGEAFRDTAPTTAARAATIILEGVRQNRWRILVGDDAVVLDSEVRADPEHAYDPEFWEALQARGIFGGFGS
jgi:NAD(P)-dependent dehydrogenase (short-subunit alcohol dehydrogenase family)